MSITTGELANEILMELLLHIYEEICFSNLCKMYGTDKAASMMLDPKTAPEVHDFREKVNKFKWELKTRG